MTYYQQPTWSGTLSQRHPGIYYTNPIKASQTACVLEYPELVWSWHVYFLHALADTPF